MGVIGRIKAKRKAEKQAEADQKEAISLLVQQGMDEGEANDLFLDKEERNSVRARAILADPENAVSASEAAEGDDVFKGGRTGRQARRDVKRDKKQSNKREGATIIKGRKKKLEARFEKRNKRLKKRQDRRKKMRDFFLGEDPTPAEEQQIGGEEGFLEETVGTATDLAAEAQDKADAARQGQLDAADSLSDLFDTGTELIEESAEQQQFGREGQSALRDLVRSTPSLAQAQADITGERLREQQAVAQAGGADLGSILSGQVQVGEQFAGQTGAAVGAESIGREEQIASLLGQSRGQDLSQMRLGQQIQLAGAQNQIAAQSKLLGAARTQKQIQDRFKLGLQTLQLKSDLAIQFSRSQQKGSSGVLGGVIRLVGAGVGGAIGGPAGAKVGGTVGGAIGSGVSQGQARRNNQTKPEGAR